MPGIRTIKPQFFLNEELAELPAITRLLFIGLWTQSDFEGRLLDKPKRLKAQIFPYDNSDVDQNLSLLQSAGFIKRYEVSELKVIQVINFKRHQQITGSEAETKSELPEEVLAGNNDVAKFWDVIQTLLALELIQEGKDFSVEDGYIYLRLMQVYPLYKKELRQRGDANVLAKPTLEHYLKLDKTVFEEYVRKRFHDGSNNWCYKMKYDKLGIDMIKIKQMEHTSIEHHQTEVDKKYRAMGIAIGDPECVVAELPFLD